MKSTWLRRAFLGLAAACLAVPARAQTPGAKLIDLFENTYTESLYGRTGLFQQVNPDLFELKEFKGLSNIPQLNSAVVAELGSFPLGSSSGGFTYVFDRSTGVGVRSSKSFGPAFAERPLTNGRGKLNLGMTYLHRRYDKLEGGSLRDGEMKVYDALAGVNTSALFDVVESTVTIAIDNDTTTFFGTYGVTDRLDVGVAIPLQRVTVDATVRSGLVRFNAIPAGVSSNSGSASGFGDVAVRAKYGLWNHSDSAVAAGIDVRLPTGDADNLLGTGVTRVKAYGAVSSGLSRRVSPHANFGYTFGSKEDVNGPFIFGTEMSYAGGAEAVVNPRLTVVGDIIGRSLANEGRYVQEPSTFDLLASPVRTNPSTGQFVTEPRTVTGYEFHYGERLNLLLGTAGVKFSPTSTFLISAHVLFPLSKNGLQSGFTPVIGVDYTF
jgi:hypothetical protein